MKRTEEYKPTKGLSIITSNKKVVASIFIAAYIFVTVIVYYIVHKDLESTYYISQIIGGIFIVSGLVVSVLQYTAAYVDKLVLNEKEKKIRAAEMANEFQAEIIPLSITISAAYAKSGLNSKLLPKIENMKLEMFDRDEVLRIVSEQEISNAFSQLCAGYLIDHYEGKNIVKNEDGTIVEMKIDRLEMAHAKEKMDASLINLANKLEYFSICFNSGIADEDMVYQSLHKAFFQCVHMLYIFVFYDNVLECDRLFSNVSALYLNWYKRYEDLIEKENKEVANMKKSVKEKIVVKSKK